MVNLREIKKDHTVLGNDFFKTVPFIDVKFLYIKHIIIP